MKAPKVVRILFSAFVGFVVGVTLLFLAWRYVIDPLQYHAEFWLARFDAAAWKAEAPTGGIQHTQRRCMIHDLTRHYLRKGMSRSEVVSLLGDPRGHHGQRTMDYWLGYPRWWLTLDHDILEIFLDESDKVTGWRVRNT